MYPEASRNRGYVADAFLERFGGGPCAPKMETFKFCRTILGAIFDEKPNKWHPKRHPKIDAEKVSKNDAKRIQNDAKMDAEIYDFSCFFEKGENARNYLFYNSFRGSRHLKMHQKSIQNLCKIDARKRHAKSMENDAKMHPKWEPKSINNLKNTGKNGI